MQWIALLKIAIVHPFVQGYLLITTHNGMRGSRQNSTKKVVGKWKNLFVEEKWHIGGLLKLFSECTVLSNHASF